MLAKIKANKIWVLLLFFVCLIFIINPAIYSASCLNAISVWSLNVLPTLLPFFIITRMIVGLIDQKPNFADKIFNKIYNTPALFSTIYLLSSISGYPMGAKLICNLNENGYINKQDAKRMLAICSVSGPMFIVGTVGVSIFFSYKAGLIILIANLIASLINGLIYRGKKQALKTESKQLPSNKNSDLLQNSVYDALVSVLMVGAFIVLSFLVIDVLKNLGVFNWLANIITVIVKPANKQVIQAALVGFVEITRGAIELAPLNISLATKTVIASGLIGFGGISVLLQSISFLSKLKIKTSYIFLQKLTQGIICVFVTLPIALIFL